MTVKKAAKAKRTNEDRSIQKLTKRITALERQLARLESGPTVRSTPKQEAETRAVFRQAKPKKYITIGAKIEENLAIYYQVQSKLRRLRLSTVINRALRAAYGTPDD